MKKAVGFVGLGQMGKWMALNILNNDFEIWVYDIRKEAVDEVVKQGANAAPELVEIGNRCDRIVLSLPDTSVVESVLFGPEGLNASFRPGQIIIDCSTTHPLFTQKTSAHLKEKGVMFLDAAVSGGDLGARQGQLTIMAGGDEEAFHTVSPILEAMGKTIVHIGDSGSGQLAKMFNNVLFDISCAAMAEILPMALKLGLDPEKICSVVSNSSGQSYGFDNFSPLVLERNFGPGYPMKSAYKDMATIMELSNTYQIPLSVTAATMHTYQTALALGLGDENKGAMIKVWEKLLGVTVEKNEKKEPPA
jgi:3-hydroxyisobutyrate dehydrogenase-like beta-hydroxyacid dehydrogenase